jgi:hypothetical protein
MPSVTIQSLGITLSGPDSAGMYTAALQVNMPFDNVPTGPPWYAPCYIASWNPFTVRGPSTQVALVACLALLGGSTYRPCAASEAAAALVNGLAGRGPVGGPLATTW